MNSGDWRAGCVSSHQLICPSVFLSPRSPPAAVRRRACAECVPPGTGAESDPAPALGGLPGPGHFAKMSADPKPHPSSHLHSLDPSSALLPAPCGPLLLGRGVRWGVEVAGQVGQTQQPPCSHSGLFRGPLPGGLLRGACRIPGRGGEYIGVLGSRATASGAPGPGCLFLRGVGVRRREREGSRGSRMGLSP